MKKQLITLVKLGGSVITDKEVPMKVRADVLSRLVDEIAQAYKDTNSKFIIGHGAGSFAHVPATKYQTINGFINDQSLLGMAITQDSAARLNRIVVEAFLKAKLPAVSFAFSNNLVTAKQKLFQWGGGSVLESYIEKELLPITFGDVLVDKMQGCTIWSTEKIFSFLVEWINKTELYEVNRVIHVGQVDGVLDENKQLVASITRDTSGKLKNAITKTSGYDVTGGMWHKIQESLQLADQKIETYVLSGLTKNNLYNSLIGNDWVGTHIK